MADDKKPVVDVPIVEEAAEKPGVEESAAEKPAIEEVKAGETGVEEPVSSPTAPADDTATSAGTDQLGRQLYNAKCAKCGKQAQVPFKPSGDRPVYCRDCYMEQRRG